MQVLVIREVFVESPDMVVPCDDRDEVTAVIDSHYPGAELDGNGGFDLPDGTGYVYDLCTLRQS